MLASSTAPFAPRGRRLRAGPLAASVTSHLCSDCRSMPEPRSPYVPMRANVLLSAAGSTGLVIWRLNPASRARRLSSVNPHPETATRYTPSNWRLARTARDVVAIHSAKQADVTQDRGRMRAFELAQSRNPVRSEHHGVAHQLYLPLLWPAVSGTVGGLDNGGAPDIVGPVSGAMPMQPSWAASAPRSARWHG
jgi:hypothetical protein